MNTKSFLKSKTLWVNTIAFIAGLIQMRYGLVIDAEYQVMALGAINGILRLVTGDAIGLTDSKP